MQKVTILVGVIGSGKSTYAKMLAEQNLMSVVVNKDAIRTMLRGEYAYRLDIETVVKNCATAALLTALRQGLDVVIDETNISKAKRKDIIKPIRDMFHDSDSRINIEAIEFAFGPECLNRRLKENRGYSKEKWVEVFNVMVRDFEPVTEEEGFDSHVLINNLQKDGTQSAG